MPPTDLFTDLDPSADPFGPAAADRLLAWAVENHATDVHLLPTTRGYTVSARSGGVLQPVCEVAAGGQRLVARLKVMAGLLTYRSDVPQEGRLPFDDSPTSSDPSREARLATCPTVLGEKAVIRLFPAVKGLESVADLGLPPDVLNTWTQLLSRQSGLLLMTGPAGSGKTTTAYASIRTVLQASASPRSIVSLEDPVEQLLPGVAQTSVGGTTGLSFADGLRAVLRHDPEVLLVGELRDRDTIETAMRAALTGHLVLATLHTGSAAEAVLRLLDADVEPFLILSGLLGVLHQRLARTADGDRAVCCELLTLSSDDVREAIRGRHSADQLEAAAVAAGMPPIITGGRALLNANQIDAGEFMRLFPTHSASVS